MRLRYPIAIALGLTLVLTAVYFGRPQREASIGHAKDRDSSRMAPPVQSSPPSRPPAIFPSRLTSTTAKVDSVGFGQDEKRPFPVRNTEQLPEELVHNPKVLLLRNAWIDTAGKGLELPGDLRSDRDPETYIVQACGLASDKFRDAVAKEGGTIVSYVPNNAYLVRISAEGATKLTGASCAVLPYEPFYKLDKPLLENAVRRKPMLAGETLRITLFPGERDAAMEMIHDSGGRVVGENRSPFGPELIVEVLQRSAEALVTFARSPSVQNIETCYEKIPANDLTRVRLGISTNAVTNVNFFGLAGSNVWVNVNDVGIHTNHPDLSPRLFVGERTNPTNDPSGHGTFVAGVIASSGSNGPIAVLPGSLTNAWGSESNANFRGMAPAASLLALDIDNYSDFGMIEAAARTNYVLLARTNTLISNNSWNYGRARVYNSAAATYDAAVRDAIPDIPGMQPVLLVFSAGNGGGGNQSGSGGDRNSILSPGTAKNVITVGGLESPRFITNEVWVTNIINGTNVITTNTPFLPSTDSSNQVRWNSGRGNIGYNIEGEFGRFKPDVVAPGSFIISTRSADWDTTNYYNPTNVDRTVITNIVLGKNETNNSAVFIPRNCVGLGIFAVRNTNSPNPLPPLMIFTNLNFDPVPSSSMGNFAATNSFVWPDSDPSFVTNVEFFFDIVNTNSGTVDFDLVVDVLTTNNVGNYFQVLSNLNEKLAPYYRYESGSSVAAPAVSGMLALLQEYFAKQTTGVTNPSPALLKALIINGARRVGPQYALDPNTDLNLQGWGLPDIRRSVPGTNLSTGSMLMFEQESVTNCVGTDEMKTQSVTLSSNAQAFPLRVTLVWTDPPGNPAVGVKLVNDLDLIVTNEDTGDIYFGNNFQGGDFSSLSGFRDTNGEVTLVDSPSDVVNNVENVFLNGPLGSKYSITVLGKRVNVNAVNAQTNGIKQDYALVISSGNLALTNALVVTNPAALAILPASNVIELTNGVALFGERVGANSPLLDPAPNAGNTNQWRFYVLDNSNAMPNIGVLIFDVPDLSGTSKKDRPVPTVRNVEADIDLYVSTEFALTNLDPGAVMRATKSTNRLGTELITLNNGVAGKYYIGIKSEDQRAAEFGLFAVATNVPFTSQDADGNPTVTFMPIPRELPDGLPDNPSTQRFFGFYPGGQPVRRVLIQPMIEHDLYADLVMTLSDGVRTVIINNHSFPDGQQSGVFTNMYNDLDEGDWPEARVTDGPGNTLAEFMGESPTAWYLTIQDNAESHTGRVQEVRFIAEPRPEPDGLFGDFIQRCIPANRFFNDFIDVEGDVTNIVVEVFADPGSGSDGSLLEVYLRRGARPDRTTYDKTATFELSSTVTNTLNLSIDDSPPLVRGRYFVRFYNPNGTQVCIRYRIYPVRNLEPALITTFTETNAVPLIDDALTTSTISVTNTNVAVVDVSVGVRIDHPRVSDLSLHLVSPNGTRILLFENRGGLTTNGLGARGLPTTNFLSLLESGFETVAPGFYSEPGQIEGWNVLSGITGNTNIGSALVVSNASMANEGAQYLSLRRAGIIRDLPTLSNGNYRLTYAYRTDYLTPVHWWKADGDTADSVGGVNGSLIGATFGQGLVGSAFNFDGIDDSVRFPSSVGNFSTNDFTIDFWINTTSQRFQEAVVGKRQNCDGSSGWDIRIGGPSVGVGKLNFFVSGGPAGSFNSIVGTRVVNDGVWHHVAAVRAGPTLILYVDGAVDASGTVALTAAINNSADVTLGTEVCVGSDTTERFTGLLDEFAIYNRSLSAEQVSELFLSGAGGKCGTTTPPTNCSPATAKVTLDATVTNLVASTNWLTNITLFTASTNTTPLRFEGIGPYTQSVTTNDVEGIASGVKATGTTLAGWNITRSNIAVVSEPLFAKFGTNVLSINCIPNTTNTVLGVLTQNVNATVGGQYSLQFAYRRAHSSLINWWRGNSNTTDVIGGQNGTLQNGATYTTTAAAGMSGPAFTFDGIDDHISCGTSAGNVGTNDFTLDFWIRTSSTRSLEALISKRVSCGQANMLDLRIGDSQANGKLVMELSSGFSSQYHVIRSVAAVNNGNYQHVAFTRKGTTCAFYINGQLDATATFANIANINNNAQLYFGRSPCIGGGDGSAYFSGELDEIGFHNRAISADEIRSIFLARSAGRRDSSHPPTNSLPPSAMVVVNGTTNVVYGTSNWNMFSTNFIATSTNLSVTIQGTTNGLWIEPLAGPQQGPHVFVDSILLEGEEVDPGIIYATFTENTNLASEFIKFARPPYATNSTSAPPVLLTNSWETVASGLRSVGANVENWIVVSNNVAVVTDSDFAESGTNILSLNVTPGIPSRNHGSITRTFATEPGKTYDLNFETRRAHSSLVHWWRGESNVNDTIGGIHGTNFGTTFSAGEVGRAFDFDGVNDSVSFSAAVGNFGTNDFTIDYWMKTSSTRQEALIGKRQICNSSSAWDFRMGEGGIGTGKLNFYVYESTGHGVLSSRPLNDGVWHHIAGVRRGASLSLYIDGVLDTNNTFAFTASVSNAAPLSLATQACVPGDGTALFTGQLDEIGVHNRAISSEEIRSIYLAGSGGRCDSSNPPLVCQPAAAVVTVAGGTNALVATNVWKTAKTPFIATNTSTTARIDGTVNGFWVDSLEIIERVPTEYFLPEEELSLLLGERAAGDWRLEIWDTRTGAFLNAQLVSWQLHFTFANLVPPTVVTPLSGCGTTFIVVSNNITYFSVQVPASAAFATNRLTSLTGGGLDLLFNQNALPTGAKAGDFILLNNATVASRTLSTAGPVPILRPGQRYYLGVRNNNTSQSNNFTLCVTFDATDAVRPSVASLPNGFRVGSSIPAGAELQYFQIDVATNAVSATFEILQPSGNVDLYLSEDAPLPNTQTYTARSMNPGTSSERIVLLPSSYPALTPGRWYIGVFNRNSSPVSYTIRATQQLPVPGGNIVTLVSGAAVNVTAGPGAALTNYFRFVVSGTNTSALFEVYNLTADADLVLRQGALPSIGEYDFVSGHSGLMGEQIVVRNGEEVDTVAGEWFLGVPNNDSFNFNYTVRATVATGGMLVSGQPPKLSRQPTITSAGNLRLQWNSVAGERYQILGSTDLSTWNPIQTITATSSTTTYELPGPTTGTPHRFYRIVHVP